MPADSNAIFVRWEGEAIAIIDLHWRFGLQLLTVEEGAVPTAGIDEQPSPGLELNSSVTPRHRRIGKDDLGVWITPDAQQRRIREIERTSQIGIQWQEFELKIFLFSHELNFRPAKPAMALVARDSSRPIARSCLPRKSM